MASVAKMMHMLKAAWPGHVQSMAGVKALLAWHGQICTWLQHRAQHSTRRACSSCLQHAQLPQDPWPASLSQYKHGLQDCVLQNSLLVPSTATKSRDVQKSRACWISAWEGTCLHDEVINEKGVDQAQHGVHSPLRAYVFLHTTS